VWLVGPDVPHPCFQKLDGALASREGRDVSWDDPLADSSRATASGVPAVSIDSNARTSTLSHVPGLSPVAVARARSSAGGWG